MKLSYKANQALTDHTSHKYISLPTKNIEFKANFMESVCVRTKGFFHSNDWQQLWNFAVVLTQNHWKWSGLYFNIWDGKSLLTEVLQQGQVIVQAYPLLSISSANPVHIVSWRITKSFSLLKSWNSQPNFLSKMDFSSASCSSNWRGNTQEVLFSISKCFLPELYPPPFRLWKLGAKENIGPQCTLKTCFAILKVTHLDG